MTIHVRGGGPEPISGCVVSSGKRPRRGAREEGEPGVVGIGARGTSSKESDMTQHPHRGAQDPWSIQAAPPGGRARPGPPGRDTGPPPHRSNPPPPGHSSLPCSSPGAQLCAISLLPFPVPCSFTFPGRRVGGGWRGRFAGGGTDCRHRVPGRRRSTSWGGSRNVFGRGPRPLPGGGGASPMGVPGPVPGLDPGGLPLPSPGVAVRVEGILAKGGRNPTPPARRGSPAPSGADGWRSSPTTPFPPSPGSWRFPGTAPGAHPRGSTAPMPHLAWPTSSWAR